MTDQTEDMPLEELKADHIRMEKQLLGSKNGQERLHFQISLWIKSSGRSALVYAAVLAGLAMLSASNVLIKSARAGSGTLVLIATVSVTFFILWLTTSQEP